MSESIAGLRWPAVTTRGVPGLAVRVGRALEEWGERAASPEARAEHELRRALHAAAHRENAAHEQALRAGYRGL